MTADTAHVRYEVTITTTSEAGFTDAHVATLSRRLGGRVLEDRPAPGTVTLVVDANGRHVAELFVTARLSDLPPGMPPLAVSGVELSVRRHQQHRRGSVEAVTEHRPSGDTIRLTFDGDFDAAARGTVERIVDETLKRRPFRMLIDLCGVSFLDSSGLGMLVRAALNAHSQGTLVACECPATGMARTVIEMAGLQRQLGLIT